MGQNIDQLSFSEKDYSDFQDQLYRQLTQLKEITKTPSFGKGTLYMGAELEMYLIDDLGNISLSNQLLLDELNDKQYQPELNQYNLELNLSATHLAGTPFSNLADELSAKLTTLNKIANKHHIHALPIGILPTLKHEHLNTSYMTDIPRYHCLAKHLYQQRGEDFVVNINGEEPLSVNFEDICAEGANTSFQVHLMTEPDKLVNTFNAAQLTLPLVTAIGANSSIFLGHSLWDETRIALFKQSLDIRQRSQFQWQEPTRVNFGHGWIRNNICELFDEAVALYNPLLPYLNKVPTKSTLPSLNELSLHLGTIWPWHRPVYSNKGNGHIRIEFRAIPAGPTVLDMTANATFAIGLAAGLSEEIEDLISRIPFRFAEYNFYRAAQHGLDAKILWPLDRYQPKEVDITSVIAQMLPIAMKGLISLNIDANEAESYLSIIEQRLVNKITGASWQKKTLKHLEQRMDKQAACHALVQQYLANYHQGSPVATWEQSWK